MALRLRPAGTAPAPGRSRRHDQPRHKEGSAVAIIWGRPQNLILGAVTALFNVVILVLGSQGIAIPPEVVAAVNIAAGAVVAVIAYQPPTLNPGDTLNVTTPPGQPTAVTTVATPPAADAAPVMTPNPPSGAKP